MLIWSVREMLCVDNEHFSPGRTIPVSLRRCRPPPSPPTSTENNYIMSAECCVCKLLQKCKYTRNKNKNSRKQQQQRQSVSAHNLQLAEIREIACMRRQMIYSNVIELLCKRKQHISGWRTDILCSMRCTCPVIGQTTCSGSCMGSKRYVYTFVQNENGNNQRQKERNKKNYILIDAAVVGSYTFNDIVGIPPKEIKMKKTDTSVWAYTQRV